MSRTVAYLQATPDRVFAVLEDAQSYSYWVVGCKKIRDVERDWPHVGSGFHHTVGVGPLAIRDETRVLRIEPPRLLELQARAWPAGEARVTLHLQSAGAGTRVEMIEVPIAGPAKRMHNPVLDAAAHARNTVALRRLARLAEGRL